MDSGRTRHHSAPRNAGRPAVRPTNPISHRLTPMRLLFVFLALTVPAIAGAQTKQQLMADWARNRTNVLAYVDAMPDSAMSYRPTPEVRTFAEQIEHIVTTDLDVAARALAGATELPIVADTAVILHDRTALRAYTDSVYMYVIEVVRGATPSLLARPAVMYGQAPQSTARLLQMALEHGIFTLGQTVPYLRLNGVTPPVYSQPF